MEGSYVVIRVIKKPVSDAFPARSFYYDLDSRSYIPTPMGYARAMDIARAANSYLTVSEAMVIKIS